MNNEEYCNRIKYGLGQLVAEVRQDAVSNLHSINVHAEGFFRAFLNELFGWQLSNANAAEPNAKGIDLLYPGGNVVVQVSSTTTHEKIQKSLEKSARFPGAHFLFVAIDDHLPNYQKPFDKHGLIFDPENDILDVPRLHSRAVQCGDRGTRREIDIQQALAELTDKYFSQTVLSRRLALPRLGSGAARNLFEYNRNIVRLYGREAEMARLREFLAQEVLFGWWAITAPGGAGKTRLAYELQNRLLEEGQWDVRVIPASTLNASDGKLSELSELCPGRTLLIVDYVQQHTEALKTLLERLSEPELRREAPLRLLLLERDVRDENDRIVWLDKLLGTDHHIIDTFYTQKPMELQPLSAKEGEADPLEQLIREFADWLCENTAAGAGFPGEAGLPPDGEAESKDADGTHPLRGKASPTPHVLPAGKERELSAAGAGFPGEAGFPPDDDAESNDADGTHPLRGKASPTPHVLPAGKERELRKKLEDIDPGLLRPLYAMILTDAWVQDPETEHWSQEELLSHIVRREWDMAAKRIKPYHDPDSTLLPGACRNLWCVATVLSAGGKNLDLARIEELLPEEWDILSDAAREHEKRLKTRGILRSETRESSLVKSLLNKTGFFADGKVTPLRPDLLGEFFVLKSLEEIGSAEKTAFYTAVLEEPEAALEFFSRMLNDYGTLLTDESKFFDFDQAFPPEPKLDREHTASYARLLRRLFENSRSRDVRTRLVARLTALAAGQTAEDDQTGRILDDAASVLEDAGKLSKALEFFEKDLAITEKVLGKKHTETAASYNNIANVYRAMGNNPKALKFHKKALAIKEKLLGTDHPSTATSYNNIALVYKAMGDYPKALEFHEKALAITEKLLGTEHPDTAASYNNIASVYYAMGDYPKALEFHKKALAIKEKLLGTDHPSTALSYHNLSVLYYETHELAEALRYSDLALSVFQRILGAEHPWTKDAKEFNEYLKQLSAQQE